MTITGSRDRDGSTIPTSSTGDANINGTSGSNDDTFSPIPTDGHAPRGIVTVHDMHDVHDTASDDTEPYLAELALVRGADVPGADGLADVHMHTNYSDGTGSVEEVLRFAQEHTDLDVLAITDHDTIEGALRARDLAARGNYRFEVIVGEEISTREGHMLALFVEKRIPPDLSIERSIELVHAQGGLAVVAHPFNRIFRHSVQASVMNRLLRQPDVHPDGVETLNGSFAGIGSSQVAMARVRSRYHWAETGGSDAHTPTAVGCAYTVFPGRTTSDLRAALLARQTAPRGGFWKTREYVAFVQHRVRHGGAATFAADGAELAGIANGTGERTTRLARLRTPKRRAVGREGVPVAVGE